MAEEGIFRSLQGINPGSARAHGEAYVIQSVTDSKFGLQGKQTATGWRTNVESRTLMDVYLP